jgi:hypothetical protein
MTQLTLSFSWCGYSVYAALTPYPLAKTCLNGLHVVRFCPEHRV